MATLYDYIERLWDDFGIAAALPVEHVREYVVPVEEGLTVGIYDVKGHGYYLHADICELPDGEREDFYAHALSGNLFGQGTDHAVIGMSGDMSTLVVSRLLPYSIDYAQFSDAFDDFCNTVVIWRNEAHDKITTRRETKQFF